MEAVEFKQPVHVGDLLSFFTYVEKVGTSSVRVRVLVEAERQGEPNVSVRVTEASVIFVAVDEQGHKMPIRRV